ncbi:cellulase family glycosylhydrolase [Teichococcus aestuarii]|uniref:Cadherin domain-containing protein n=1 Tax=Teichococcus aestuarii TaxID=568898 RepID=A0A2U1UY71_9PROT|nr:cellulase family glycosylhydrolase [Pseudoroseomonas aestuarii]PWC26597.1 hypothetical protein CR165_22425 [Pseudoroseomonas aestuarii]
MAPIETVLPFRLIEATIFSRDGIVTIQGVDGSVTKAPAGGRYVFTDGVVNDADGQVLVEDLLYYARNHDVWLAGIDADEHFVVSGWQEGRDMGGLFDSAGYLAANPDVAASGMDPLLHYRVFGWREGRDPSPFFDTAGYLKANLDVAAAGINPLEHYIAFGRYEGRTAEPGLLRVQGFDDAYYLAANPDVSGAGMDAHQHYVLFGRTEGRAPSAMFDAQYYLAQNPDVAASDMDPLSHYMRFGWQEKRDPSARFDTAKYLESNPDVALEGVNPLTHYLTYGAGEGRLPRPVDEAPSGITLSSGAVDEALPGAVVGKLTVSDPDGGLFSYSVNDDRFKVVDGSLKLRDDVELGHESEAELRLTVTVMDSTGLSLSHTFDIAVNDANEAPTDIALDLTSTYENVAGAVVGRLSAADPDDGDRHTFVVDDDRFEVTEDILKLKDDVRLDHEMELEVTVTIRATDAQGLILDQSFTLPVLDANDMPAAIRLSGDKLPENSVGAVVGTLSVIDQDAGDTHGYSVSDARFEVVAGVLKLKDDVSLDHEAEPEVTVTVQAADAGGLSVKQDFTLAVQNVNNSIGNFASRMSDGILDLFGVNIAGASFGTPSASDAVGTSHIYPSHADIDYFAAKGMDVIRLDLKWERLQPDLAASLDEAEMKYVDEAVDYAASKGVAVIVSLHNYGKYNENFIDKSTVEASDFQDVWCRLSGRYLEKGNVIFGLMNEPYDHTTEEWIDIANAGIAAIRSTGATQQILVPGTYFSGAHNWVSSDNDTVVGDGIVDPLGNFAIEVHQYLDSDNSGSHYGPVASANIGVERIIDVTTWAEATGNKLFLGEFGVGSDAVSLAALDNMLGFMRQHGDVWQGGTYWAAGDWWGDYAFSVQPSGTSDKPQMAILDKYVSPQSQPYWLEAAHRAWPAVPTSTVTGYAGDGLALV